MSHDISRKTSSAQLDIYDMPSRDLSRDDWFLAKEPSRRYIYMQNC